MFNLNDYVVYGSNGVCKIQDITKEKGFSGNEEEYYILTPVYNDKMKIKTPVNNNRILMRNILSENEVHHFIKEMSNNEIFEIEDAKRKIEAFKLGLRSGEIKDLIKIINSINLEKKGKESVGKKLNKTEEDIMGNAKKQIYQEFAIVLNIDFEDVKEYILNNI